MERITNSRKFIHVSSAIAIAATSFGLILNPIKSFAEDEVLDEVTEEEEAQEETNPVQRIEETTTTETTTTEVTTTALKRIVNKFEIFGYQLDFDEFKNDYTLDIYNVNKIHIDLEGENITVNGAGDIDITDKDEITIEVIDNETQESKKYNIKLNRIKEANAKKCLCAKNKFNFLNLLSLVAMCIAIGSIIFVIVKNKKTSK